MNKKNIKLLSFIIFLLLSAIFSTNASPALVHQTLHALSIHHRGDVRPDRRCSRQIGADKRDPGVRFSRAERHVDVFARMQPHTAYAGGAGQRMLLKRFEPEIHGLPGL